MDSRVGGNDEYLAGLWMDVLCTEAPDFAGMTVVVAGMVRKGVLC